MHGTSSGRILVSLGIRPTQPNHVAMSTGTHAPLRRIFHTFPWREFFLSLFNPSQRLSLRDAALTVTIRAELCRELSGMELLYQQPTGGSLSRIRLSMMPISTAAVIDPRSLASPLGFGVPGNPVRF